jgi:hypothetical protein
MHTSKGAAAYEDHSSRELDLTVTVQGLAAAVLILLMVNQWR